MHRAVDDDVGLMYKLGGSCPFVENARVLYVPTRDCRIINRVYIGRP
jgi:hypothetical protein